jgi:hypothetical protein
MKSRRVFSLAETARGLSALQTEPPPKNFRTDLAGVVFQFLTKSKT